VHVLRRGDERHSLGISGTIENAMSTYAGSCTLPFAGDA
jgi:hypothetical protein